MSKQIAQTRKKGKVKYIELAKVNLHDVDGLLKVYRENPAKARIKYMLSSTFEKPATNRLGVFHKNKKDWTIFLGTKRWGINKVTRLYSSEKKMFRITYNSKGLWFINSNGKVKSFQPRDLDRIDFIGLNSSRELVKEEIIKRLPFMENIYKNDFSDLTFDTVKRNKLYQLKRLVRFKYGISLRTFNNIGAGSFHEGLALQLMKRLKLNAPYLTKTDCLRQEWFKQEADIFTDTLRFARALGKVINCNWSDARLKLEHDKWYKEIADILYKGDLTPLTIEDIYIDFAEFSGFELIKTTDELYGEGLLQKHCVATYIPQVNSGECAIYHVNGNTLELRKDWSNKSELIVNQFRGWKNQNAPAALRCAVDAAVAEFNENNAKKAVEVPELKYGWRETVAERLPF